MDMITIDIEFDDEFQRWHWSVRARDGTWTSGGNAATKPEAIFGAGRTLMLLAAVPEPWEPDQSTEAVLERAASLQSRHWLPRDPADFLPDTG